MKNFFFAVLFVIPAFAFALPDSAHLEAAAMRGDGSAALSLGLAQRKSAYVWLRVADNFKRDKSRVPTILANKLEQSLQPEEIAEADREVECLIKQIEKNRPTMQQLMKAAMNGDANAQGELGWRYCLGDGANNDPGAAYMWAVVADSFGYAVVPGETMPETVAGLNNTPANEIEQARAKAQRLIEEIKKNQSNR